LRSTALFVRAGAGATGPTSRGRSGEEDIGQSGGSCGPSRGRIKEKFARASGVKKFSSATGRRLPRVLPAGGGVPPRAGVIRLGVGPLGSRRGGEVSRSRGCRESQAAPRERSSGSGKSRLGGCARPQQLAAAPGLGHELGKMGEVGRRRTRARGRPFHEAEPGLVLIQHALLFASGAGSTVGMQRVCRGDMSCNDEKIQCLAAARRNVRGRFRNARCCGDDQSPLISPRRYSRESRS